MLSFRLTKQATQDVVQNGATFNFYSTKIGQSFDYKNVHQVIKQESQYSACRKCVGDR